MKTPSKLMCQLASLSRGLDHEQHEYRKKSRYELSLKLRKITNRIQELEAQEHDSFIRLTVANDCGISMLEAINQGAPIEDLRAYAVDIIEACDLNDNEKTPAATNS